MENKRLHPVFRVCIDTDRKCFGPELAMLLRRVERLHSLRAAVLDMEITYSKAQAILREAETGLQFPLVHSTTGGRNGGGAVLTPKGLRMLETYEQFEKELNEAGEELFRKHFGEFF
ncbi:MAG: ModE family transcriptional regulator [Oscillospiraceae bacterium]|nr:ModE family transcriptional regulator [Oscillospiraceae bacterium]